MDQATFVQAFINLPQPQRNIDGHWNHWHFAFQPVPGPVSQSILFLVNPYSRIGYSAGVVDLVRCSREMTYQQMGLVWVLLIMHVLVRPDVGQIRPFTWSTDTGFMVEAVGSGLRQLGIAGMMPRVCLAGMSEIGIAIEVWSSNFLMLNWPASAVMGGEGGAESAPTREEEEIL